MKSQNIRQKANTLLQKGDLQQAKKLFEKVLKNFKHDPELHLILGYICGQTGEASKAITYLIKASTLQPKNPQTHYNLGVAYQDYRDYPKAINCFRTVLELAPGMMEAKYNLALSFHRLNEHEKAVGLLNQLHVELPANMEVSQALASCYFSLGNHEKTIKLTEKIITYNQSPKAYCLLGTAKLKENLKSEAVEAFQSALLIDPEYIDAMLALGQYYLDERNPENSVVFIKQALTQDTENLAAHLKLAHVYIDLGRPEDAIFYYRKAMRIDNQSDEAHKGLADAQEMLGQWDDAILTYKQMIHARIGVELAEAGMAHIFERKNKPDEAMAILQRQLSEEEPNILALCTFGNLSRERKTFEEAIECCEKALTRNALPKQDKRLLHYTLGKLYNDAKDYHSAFLNFHAGNELEKELHWHQYDEEKQKNFVDWSIEKYTPSMLEIMPTSLHKSRTPVFVVGMPRSGTSLTEQIIASHPEADGAGELPDVYDFAQSLPENIGNIKNSMLAQSLDQLNQERLNIFSEEYTNKISQKSPRASRIVDKMPGNFLYLGLIRLAFPNAYIIHCKRNPIDTCLSIYFQQFTSSQSYANNLSALGHYYCEYLRLMKHWNKILPNNIHNLNYEQLTQNPDTEIRKIVSFLELKWNDNCLKFHKNKRDVNTPSYQQVRQPIYSSSVERWRNYAPYINELIESLSPCFTIDDNKLQ